jgi:hypothetical protein
MLLGVPKMGTLTWVLYALALADNPGLNHAPQLGGIPGVPSCD